MSRSKVVCSRELLSHLLLGPSLMIPSHPNRLGPCAPERHAGIIYPSSGQASPGSEPPLPHLHGLVEPPVRTASTPRGRIRPRPEPLRTASPPRLVPRCRCELPVAGCLQHRIFVAVDAFAFTVQERTRTISRRAPSWPKVMDPQPPSPTLATTPPPLPAAILCTAPPSLLRHRSPVNPRRRRPHVAAPRACCERHGRAPKAAQKEEPRHDLGSEDFQGKLQIGVFFLNPTRPVSAGQQDIWTGQICSGVFRTAGDTLQVLLGLKSAISHY
ncbi:hypothetical protein BRADI_1g03627v3 [Brachypodium distachyon]|uniref:Uncharacterized protein n=1 Tax=Brachypodium distachyon TaxID=15368 RepID=A0A0Q3J386_BRADI|nr:hypothetical protein BRADI_1g03627v3 [Brachypodium distachyon]